MGEHVHSIVAEKAAAEKAEAEKEAAAKLEAEAKATAEKEAAEAEAKAAAEKEAAEATSASTEKAPADIAAELLKGADTKAFKLEIKTPTEPANEAPAAEAP